MGLVHRNHVHPAALDGLQEAVCQQPLRGNIDDFVHSQGNIAVGQPNLVRRQGTVDIGRRHAGVLQGHDLIPHQRNQGRNHQAHPIHQQRRDLITQALAAAGGHNAEHVPARQRRVNQRLLAAPEGRIAKNAAKNRFLCLHPWVLSGRP